MRSRCFQVLHASWLSSSILAVSAGAQVPNNLNLIAAMPPGTESVIVWKDSALGSQDSWMRRIISSRDEYLLNNFGMGAPPSASTNNLRYEVFRYIIEAKPIAHARGGSRFQHPACVGVGNDVQRWIWVVEDSTAPLQERLDSRADVNKTAIRWLKNTLMYEQETEVFLGDCSVREPFFVAFPSEHVIVMAEKGFDVARMCKSLTEGRRCIPTQWAEVALGLDLESPITLLRSYNYFNVDDPSLPKDRGLPMAFRSIESEAPWIQSLGLTLPSVSERVFRLRVIGSGVDDVLRFYISFVERHLHQGCCIWESTTDGSRIQMTIHFHDRGEPLQGPFEPFYGVLLKLFGQSVAV